jgi:tetratricopeptide (TPR) repeat protein
MPTVDINLVLCIVAFAWHYCLFCGYISDDHAAVAQRLDIIPDEEKKDRGESYWVKRFNDGIVMFYQTRIFWALGLKNVPFAWHLLSLGVHLANTYLLYTFLLPVVGNDVSLYACAFWGVSPMLNQNVVWVSGRPYLFGAFLSLVALNCWQDPVAFGIFYILAVITNISIFFAPIIVWMIAPDSWQAKLYLGVMVLCAGPFVMWKFNARFTNGLVIDRDNFAWRPRKVFTFARIALYYVHSLFVPTKMGWYHQAGFRYNEKWEKFNYLTVAGFLLIGFMMWINPFAGTWFLLGLLPNANIFATNSFLQDRYLYFCSIGVALIVAPVLAKYPALFYVAMTFYVTRTYMYSRHLKDDEKLYRENWRNHPQSDYAINNLSYFLIQQRRFDEARVVVERGLHINRGNKMLWYNLGITYAAQGHFNNDEGKFKFLKAMECWKTCLAIEPRWSKPAEDLKRIIKILVENKVITLNKDEAAPHGMSISVPNLVGMKEVLDGQEAKTVTEETPAAAGSIKTDEGEAIGTLAPSY